MLFFSFFFFFQAEDGIRDHCVTGVQTCALPIYRPRRARARRRDVAGVPRASVAVRLAPGRWAEVRTAPDEARAWGWFAARSEERRVGKECRCGGSAYR